MAHARLGVLLSSSFFPVTAIAFAVIAGCGPREAPGIGYDLPAPPNHEVFAPERTLLRYHSKRFLLTLALPDGRGWRIDDHTQRRLVAHHSRTDSHFELEAFELGELANRQKCREAGLARLDIDPRSHSVIEQAVALGPEAYDTELRTTLEADRAKEQVRAHFFAFAGFLRRCIVAHAVTLGRASTFETLSDRLVTFRTQIWSRIELDDFLAQPRERRSGTGR